MTEEQGMSVERWLKVAQFAVALIALVGALIYAGQRTERDEHQSRSLEVMARELGQIRDAATEGNAQIRILGERVRGLEERTARLERR
jgi:hypothetical protein